MITVTFKQLKMSPITDNGLLYKSIVKYTFTRN
jgi:hypothetical protein